MSILDGFPTSPEDAKHVMLATGIVFDQFFDERSASPRAQSVLELLKEGLSLADIFSITREERDAVFLLACRHLQVGDLKSATPLLTQLVQLEPTDGRAIYALGVAYQSAGDPVLAGKLYLYAIALDATDPEGYLRLGECLLANRETEAARGCFEGAKVLAQSGYGTAAQVEHADRMIATLPPPAA